jgi:hypothetical protein
MCLEALVEGGSGSDVLTAMEVFFLTCRAKSRL